MPHDYDDHDEPGFGLREVIDTAAGVDASGTGYSIPSTPFPIAPYKSLAVQVTPGGGGSSSVDVTFKIDGAAGNSNVFVTKQSTNPDSDTLIFRALGDTVQDVTIRADNNTDYAVMPSDFDPLVSSGGLDWSSPQQVIPIMELGVAAAGPFTDFSVLVPDNACIHGGYLRNTPALNDAIAVRVGLSPKGSVWGFSMMHTTGPDHGKALVYLGRLPDDDPYANAAEPDPVNLLGEIDAVNGDFVYILGAAFDCYSAVFARNVVDLFGFSQTFPAASSGFRITGEPGAAMTVGGVDPDLSLWTTGDGGPGVYAMKIVMGDKRPASTGYRLGIQSLAATRHDALWT